MSIVQLVVTFAAALLVALVARRSLALAFPLVLSALTLGGSSYAGVKHVFLAARWGALLALAAIAAPAALRLALRIKPVGWAAVGLIGLSLGSTLWSVEPRLTFERGLSFSAILVVALGLAAATERDQELHRLVDATAVVMALFVVASLAAWWVDPQMAVFNGDAVRGVFENPNGLGLFAAFTYPFAATAIARRAPPWAAALVSAPLAWTCTEAVARTGLLALGTAIFVLAFIQRHWAPLILQVALTVAIALVVPMLNLGAPSTGGSGGAGGGSNGRAPGGVTSITGGTRGATQSEIGSLLGARDEAWIASAQLIDRRPVIGYGFGTGDRLFPRLGPNDARLTYFTGSNPASAYVQLGLELGIVGAVLFTAALILAAIIAWHSRLAMLAALLVAGLAAGVFESVFTAAGAPWALLIWTGAACAVTAGAVQTRI